MEIKDKNGSCEAPETIELPSDYLTHKFECEKCGKYLEINENEIGNNWFDDDEMQKGEWCRFQFGKDAQQSVLWFCCVDHCMIFLSKLSK